MKSELFAKLPFWVISEHFPHLTNGALRLYTVLLKYADFDTMTAFPSYRSITKSHGIAPATIKNGLDQLQARGLVQISRQDLNGKNCYQIADNFAQAELWSVVFLKSGASVAEARRASVAEAPGASVAEAPNSSIRKNDNQDNDNQIKQEPLIILDKENSENLSGCQTEETQLLPDFPEFDDFDIYQSAMTAMVRVGIKGDMPHQLLEQFEPESILAACNNAIAKYKQKFKVLAVRANGQKDPNLDCDFNCAGYVIASLNKAREENHQVKPSRLAKSIKDEADRTEAQARRLKFYTQLKNNSVIELVHEGEFK